MAKKPSKKKNDQEEIQKPLEIVEGTIKDDFCNYSYDVKTGTGAGFNHKVKGTGIIDPDMHIAFRTLNAHLAVIDDVFKHSGVEIVDINAMHNNELVGLYSVTGFIIKGSKDDECIILKGNKYLTSTGGRMELVTPKIPMDKLSSYPWFAELKEASDKVREEVELYHGGKYTAVEQEEKKDSAQLTIASEIEKSEVDFETAKVED